MINIIHESMIPTRTILHIFLNPIFVKQIIISLNYPLELTALLQHMFT